MQAFWREGYQSSSVKALSERLGMTRSSFYNAFESQEELFLEALDRYLARSPDGALAHQPPPGRIRWLITETFRTVCQALSTDREGKGCLAVNSVTALCNVDGKLGPIMAGHMMVRIERLERLLDAAVANEELPPETDTKACALALKVLLVGLNAMAKVVPDRTALWPAARLALQGLGILCEGDTKCATATVEQVG
ncbi:MAG: TetR/AcrR family transcriptional regulator [Erythrobacter sp.]